MAGAKKEEFENGTEAVGNEEEEEEEDSEEVINDEFERWTSLSNQMYGTIFRQDLEEVYLTFQWLPGSTETEDGMTKQRIMMGTYGDDDPNAHHTIEIIEARFKLSSEKQEGNKSFYNEDTRNFKTVTRIHHISDVNKVRYMPQDPNLVASIAGTGIVSLFAIDSYGAKLDQTAEPRLTLKCHEQNGFGLSWNAHREGYLTSSAEDGTIAVWNVNDAKSAPVSKFTLKEGVNDVQWHAAGGASNILGAVTEDRLLCIFDDRASKPVQQIEAHTSPVNSLSFNNFNPYLIATASHDSTVGLWDTRYLSSRLHIFASHHRAVDAVEWSPHSDAVLASSGRDRRVILWDIRNIGNEQLPDDVEDGPPELIFMHGGHRSRVNEFSWNPDHEWCLGSMDDECVELWRPLDHLVKSLDDLAIKDSDVVM